MILKLFLYNALRYICRQFFGVGNFCNSAVELTSMMSERPHFRGGEKLRHGRFWVFGISLSSRVPKLSGVEIR